MKLFKVLHKIFLLTVPMRYFFMDHLCYLCLVFVMLSRLFIVALRSPTGKGLTSWFWILIFYYFFHFPMCFPGLGVVLDRINS